MRLTTGACLVSSYLLLLTATPSVGAQASPSAGGVVTSTAYLSEVDDFVMSRPDDFGGLFIDEKTGVMTVQIVRATKPDWGPALVERLKLADVKLRRQNAFAVVPAMVAHSLAELQKADSAIEADSGWIAQAGSQLYALYKDFYTRIVPTRCSTARTCEATQSDRKQTDHSAKRHRPLGALTWAPCVRLQFLVAAHVPSRARVILRPVRRRYAYQFGGDAHGVEP